ncbi:MAG: AmmeMemoRadiSam system protein B [Polyangia bacterium]|jgi:AmmeMemoRadiSam system protein B|nr:AmmeMemoRadiSam system protein B [Polyangia bacterium]
MAATGCKEKAPAESQADKDDPKGPKVVRPMAKAGTWYSRDASVLGAELDRMLVSASPSPLPGRLVGLVSPHAGYRFSGPTAAYGFKLLGQARGVRRVILLGPSHQHGFRGVSVPAYTHEETPFGLLPVDPATSSLLEKPGFLSLPEAHAEEHSVELQLPFIKRVRQTVRVVPLVVGQMDDALVEQAAAALAPLVGLDTVIIASSDFTHRGGHFRFEVRRREGESLKDAVRRLDFGALPFIAALDAPGLRRYCAETRITMCGREPVAVMLATLAKAGISVESQVLNYTTSGDVLGDWESSVSYFSVALAARPPKVGK